MLETNPNVTRVFDLLPAYVAKYNLPDALACKVAGEWRKYSAQEIIQTVNQLSLGLMKMGVKKDDKIAVVSSNNRPEWNLVDFAVQQLGAVLVPMYPTIPTDQFNYIFNDARVKFVFTATGDLHAKAKEASKDLDFVEEVFTFEEVSGAANWQRVLDLGKGEDVAQLESFKIAVQNSDLLTLIYTSGTTGVPKGVMLTHGNILSNVEASKDVVPSADNQRALSFLPLCHIYERTTVYIYMRSGLGIYYAESMDTIVPNIQEIHPHVFTAVPRLLEKVYDRIVSKGYELTGLKKKIFFWAVNLGLQYDPAKDMGWWYNFRLKYARKLIFSKWQQALGGNIKVITSGAAALQPRLMRVFWAAGIPISEGYGLTETAPVISRSRVEPFEARVGCVGTIIPGVTVKIAEDGEILVKGPNVMKGYYNRPDATAEAIDTDGWFHTGDIGEIVEGAFLKITDRKKEIFKTSGGKFVAPQMVENKLKESLLIEQAIVVGEGQKFPSALLVPEFEGLKKWCSENGINYTTNEEMVKNSRVKAKIEEEVGRLNVDLAKYEQVKKFELLPQALAEATGELTPTLKPKRKVISTKFEGLILGMYE
jgi:long-chain acyl-CoA synthetase